MQRGLTVWLLTGHRHHLPPDVELGVLEHLSRMGVVSGMLAAGVWLATRRFDSPSTNDER